MNIVNKEVNMWDKVVGDKQANQNKLHEYCVVGKTKVIVTAVFLFSTVNWFQQWRVLKSKTEQGTLC